MFDFVYHTAHDVLHVNCEKPRAYFIPYESEKKALADNRADNANFISLCGEWDFKFYPTPADIEDFLREDFSLSGEREDVKIDGKYDPATLLFVIFVLLFIADWGVYCYEKYQLR